jgi:hypothetical protein
LRIDEHDSPVVSGNRHGVGRGIEQAPQSLLDALAIRNVADRGANEQAVSRLYGAEADLDGELRFIFAQTKQLETRPIGCTCGCPMKPVRWPRCLPRIRFGTRASTAWPSNSSRV